MISKLTYNWFVFFWLALVGIFLLIGFIKLFRDVRGGPVRRLNNAGLGLGFVCLVLSVPLLLWAEW